MYEALTADIFNMTKTIFKFLGLEYHAEVQKFLKSIQSLMPVILTALFVTENSSHSLATRLGERI